MLKRKIKKKVASFEISRANAFSSEKYIILSPGNRASNDTILYEHEQSKKTRALRIKCTYQSQSANNGR